MRKPLNKLVPLSVALAVSATSFASVAPAAAEGPASGSRQMEELTRGLVAAQVPGGTFLSWRYLGDEPDGISWNVYRKDGEAQFTRIATVGPRDVQPESDYETNPGIVKEDVTPSSYTDPDGTLTSVYEVAPVVDGVEGWREGMSVPMLSNLAGQRGQENRGAALYIPL